MSQPTAVAMNANREERSAGRVAVLVLCDSPTLAMLHDHANQDVRAPSQCEEC